MSEVFEKALGFTLQYEGNSYTDDPDDLGGATKYGITLGFAKGTGDLQLFDVDGDGDIDKIDIKNLTPEVAHDAYKEFFWDALNLDNFNPKIAFLLFDMSVNHGKKNAIKMLQMAINKCGQDIDVDGGIGNQTLTALNECDPDEVAEQLLDVRKDFYYKITQKRPQNKKFLKGWLSRASLCEEAIKEF